MTSQNVRCLTVREGCTVRCGRSPLFLLPYCRLRLLVFDGGRVGRSPRSVSAPDLTFHRPPPWFLHPNTEWPDRLIFIISSLIVCRRCRSLPRFYHHQMFLITNSTSTEESQTIRFSMLHKWIRLHIKLLYSKHAFFVSLLNWQLKGLWAWRVPGFFVSVFSPPWALFLPPPPVRKLNYLRGGGLGSQKFAWKKYQNLKKLFNFSKLFIKYFLFLQRFLFPVASCPGPKDESTICFYKIICRFEGIP